MHSEPDQVGLARLGSAELRQAYLIETLFVPGSIELVYTHADRAVIGGTLTLTTVSNGKLVIAVGGSTTTEVVGKFATDADVSDVLTITSVSAVANGTLQILGGTNLVYTSTNAAAGETFTYTVSDGLASATGTVTVSTYSPVGFNKLSGPVNNGDGTFTLNYLGIPGRNYALEESPDLTPPYTWFPVVTNAASGLGAIGYTVPLSYPSGSFRTRYVP